MKVFFIPLLFLGFLHSSVVNAQENALPLEVNIEDDLGNVTDAFQESFFEALKQKAIENYEKAITALRQCEKLEPENPVVHYELGKNYKLLGEFEAAVNSLQKANRIRPGQEWVLYEMMDAYYRLEEYEKAIIIAQKLLQVSDKYYDNLADLYFKSQQYEELIALLDRLDAQLGVDDYRLGLRQQIYALTNNISAQIEVIKKAIKANPDDESGYLNLIFVYSEEGMEEEAFAAAKEMRNKFPGSKVVHLALYKYYLDANETQSAVESMKIVLEAEEINTEAKFKVLTDFLLFVNDNPAYREELKEVTGLLSEAENTSAVSQKLGEYFLLQDEKERALEYFELGIEQELDNFELLTHTLLLQLDLSQYEKAHALSERAMEIFPAQPILYLIQGAALNERQEYKEAGEILIFGLDYVIDNEIMEANFYQQLAIAFAGMGDVEKAEEYQEKVVQNSKKIN